MKKILIFAISALLSLALTAGFAFAHGGGGGGGGGGGEGSSSSTESKEAKSSFNDAKKAIDKVETKIAESGGGEAASVDLTVPGTAVVAAPGVVPTKDAGISGGDKARLDGITVNKGAPTPTKLQ